jgi:hypothetical protein
MKPFLRSTLASPTRKQATMRDAARAAIARREVRAEDAS